MNGEIAMKALGLHEFGGPEVLEIATKEEPHVRRDHNMHGRARGKRRAHLLATVVYRRRIRIMAFRIGRAADPAPTPRDGDHSCRNGSSLE